jgi:hypothetical protein
VHHQKVNFDVPIHHFRVGKAEKDQDDQHEFGKLHRTEDRAAESLSHEDIANSEEHHEEKNGRG